jgi:hypothetical protein
MLSFTWPLRRASDWRYMNSQPMLEIRALADLKGRVDIAWACHEGMFSISWTESNGPPVIPPKRRGFGSTVTTSLAEMSVDGAVDLQFPQAGLTWRLTCPADKALELGALAKATSQGRADGATRA